MTKVLKKLRCNQLDSVQFNPMVVSETFRLLEQDQKAIVYESCASMGVLYPILAYQAADETYFVIDGFKRFAYAQENKHETILALVLPQSTPMTELWRLIMIEHLSTFVATDTTRAIACQFFSYCGVSKTDIRQQFAGSLGLQSHEQIMRNCYKVARLPKSVLEFAHEKKLSLKQCVQLAA